jgi:aminopeptidase N
MARGRNINSDTAIPPKGPLTMIRFALALLFVTALTAPALAAGRLPTGVTPIAYDLTVDPDAGKLGFSGSGTVTVQVAKPVKTITVNAADLTISDVKIDGRAAQSITTDAAGQTATFTFAAPVAAGRHALSMRWTGKIYQSATGLFATDYDGADGKKERMLLTQFEAPDARRFAPMWDEPGIKATFKLSAAAPAGQMAFSNMPVTRKTAGANGKTMWHFAVSPKMSSYLLFLGMGNVERKTVMAGKTEIGIITRKGVVNQGDYALASAKRLLTYFNDYFGTPYPLPKMDMIAMPGSSQFFGAMENWGAITYFERIVLIDPRLATEGQKQNIFGTVAHEMAHQWFGNIVTMAWWDDLWLNEGFASWMASKASDDLNLSWGALTQSLAFAKQGAFTRDARVTTHPIIQRIETVDQISQAFDGITYSKGEAVIRMLEGAIGADPFRAGVRRYMAKYRYGNTVTDQLWAELSAASGRPVKTIMDSFTLQGGVPMIRVAEPVCANGTTTLSLTQDRFGLDAPSKAPLTWTVPVRVGAAAGTTSTLITVKGTTPTVTTVPGCGPAIVNKGQSAYFRTLYSAKHHEALSAGFAGLTVDDQVGFLADTLALANGEYQPVEAYLTLISGVPTNASPIVWARITGHLGAIDTMLTDAPEQAAFRARARTLLAPQFARLGWTAKPGESPADAQLRDQVIPTLGQLGETTLEADAARYAMQSFATPDAVPGAIRINALQIFAYSADAARWDMLHERAKAEKSPQAKLIAYSLLGAVRDPALAQKALDLTLTDEIPLPMRGNVAAAVAGEHPAMTFDWAVANEAKVNGFLETSTRSEFIVGLASASGDPALAAKVTAWAEKNLAPGSRKPAAQVVSSITYRAGLRARQAAALGKWGAAR